MSDKWLLLLCVSFLAMLVTRRNLPLPSRPLCLDLRPPIPCDTASLIAAGPPRPEVTCASMLWSAPLQGRHPASDACSEWPWPGRHHRKALCTERSLFQPAGGDQARDCDRKDPLSQVPYTSLRWDADAAMLADVCCYYSNAASVFWLLMSGNGKLFSGAAMWANDFQRQPDDSRLRRVLAGGIPPTHTRPLILLCRKRPTQRCSTSRQPLAAK